MLDRAVDRKLRRVRRLLEPGVVERALAAVGGGATALRARPTPRGRPSSRRPAARRRGRPTPRRASASSPRRRGRHGHAPPASARAPPARLERAPRRAAAVRPRAAPSARRAPRRSPSRPRPRGPRSRACSRSRCAAHPAPRSPTAGRRSCAPACRSPGRPSSGAAGRGARCAAGSAPATSRPGCAGPASPRSRRRSRRAGRRRRGRRCPARARRRDEAAVAAELPDERRHRELAADPHEILHGLGQRQRPELAVRGRGEDGDALASRPGRTRRPTRSGSARGRPSARACTPARSPCASAAFSSSERRELNFVSARAAVGVDDGSRSI